MSFKIEKVLISEPVDACCAEILTKNGIEVVTKIGLSKDQLLKEIQKYDGLVVRSATKVTADVISAAKSLRVIGRAGTGVDNIDCDAATRHGVLVLNAPGGNTMSAAELTCGMIVTLSRNIPQACASLKSGKWDRKSFMGNELYGKTLAIVGLGRIGREVASRMLSFGMKTVGYDPLVPAEASIQFGVESLPLNQIWPIADYITVHTPLIPQTKNLINDDVLSKCKKGVKLVNCARGGIIDEEALVRALESGHCSGAGFDVYSEEPPANTGLTKHPNVICTPHIGASTVEAQTRVAEEIALQFIDLVKGKFVPGVVNSPAFCQSLSNENKSWVFLCKSLGAILASLSTQDSKGSVLTLTLQTPELAQRENALKVALLVGALKQLQHDNANFVNAPVLAKEANIQVLVSKESLNDPLLQHCVKVSLVTAEGKSHSVVGTVNGLESLLCAINGVGFISPAKLSENVILCYGKEDVMTAKLLGAIVRSGTVYSAYWSSTHENKNWCVVNAECSSKKMPEELKNLLEVYAHVAI